MEQNRFHEQLRSKMDTFVHHVYKVSRSFPKDELYALTSQLRRASLSVILNYIEGYARIRTAVYKTFLETSYGSLQESKYLIEFSFAEKYFTSVPEHQYLTKLTDEIGAMLWSTIQLVTKPKGT